MEDSEILEQARRELQNWVDQQGHNRCWYYPEVFNRLATILGVTPNESPDLPPQAEFREGCRRYEGEQYDGHLEAQG